MSSPMEYGQRYGIEWVRYSVSRAADRLVGFSRLVGRFAQECWTPENLTDASLSRILLVLGWSGISLNDSGSRGQCSRKVVTNVIELYRQARIPYHGVKVSSITACPRLEVRI